MSAMNEDWFIVKDLEGFIASTRAMVYNNFGKWSEAKEADIVDTFTVGSSSIEEFDKVLSQEESSVIIKNLLKKQRNNKTSKIRYLVSDPIYLRIIQDLNDRLVSNIITGLVSKGLVESAYDSDLNDFVFWIKDDVKNQIEKPETD